MISNVIGALPPLRLVLNTNCNGRCFYCHREGNHTSQSMSRETIIDCANIAQSLSIPQLSLTGGEPSLRSDLSEVINDIRELAPGVKVSLTSNGDNLSSFCGKVKKPIDILNLSITSFKKDVAYRYQNVVPEKALFAFHLFPAIHKNLNIVLVQDNYKEIEAIIEYCVDKEISIDFIFELKEYTDSDKILQQSFFRKIESYGEASISLKSTPVVKIIVSDKCTIHIKHPYLSALPDIGACHNCAYIGECYERICAIRVYPDKFVTACLNHKLTSDKTDIRERIQDVYNQILCNYSVLSFISSPNIREKKCTPSFLANKLVDQRMEKT